MSIVELVVMEKDFIQEIFGVLVIHLALVRVIAGMGR